MRSSRFCFVTVLGITIATLSAPSLAGESGPSWAEPMQSVHAKFAGRPGTFAHFGDSITVTLAFWTPLLYERKNASSEMEEAFALVKRHMRPECWRDWKGPKFGNEGGMTIRWAEENVGRWLAELNPETVLLMFGTNDLTQLSLEDYKAKTRAVVRKCLDNGSVVILHTIPPRHGLEKKAADFAQAVRELATEMNLPLVDYHAEILRRRPEDWDGASQQFRQYEGYDVPTLLSRDGVHPSHPARYHNDYSPEALNCWGYGLRSYLVLMKYAEVIRSVYAPVAHPKQPLRHSAPIEPQAAGNRLIEPLALLPKTPPLDAPRGEVIRVADVEALFQAVSQIRPGGTVLLADGHYYLPRLLNLTKDGVSLRGASGDPRRVLLDGARSMGGELIAVTGAAGVTIADLTVQNVRWNGIKLNTDRGVQEVTIHHCVIHNVWQRGVKGVKAPEANREQLRPTGCRVQYCLFYNDRAKQFSDDPADTADNFKGNYVGGIDVMFPKRWIIRGNVFLGIQGRTREARGAVFLWHDARECVVERNVIIDCDSGICLGNSFRPSGINIHATACIVRNNFVTRASENGILADYTRDCKILHNTIHDPKSRLGRLIRIVHDAEGLLVANNLLDGPPLRNESADSIRITTNVQGDFTRALADPCRGDLHLASRPAQVVGQALPLPDVTDDIDGRPRGPHSDIGAHEIDTAGVGTPTRH